MLVVSGVNKNYFSTSSTTVYTVCVVFYIYIFLIEFKIIGKCCNLRVTPQRLTIICPGYVEHDF